MEEFLNRATAIITEAKIKIAILSSVHSDPATLEQVLKPIYDEMGTKLIELATKATAVFEGYRVQFEALTVLMQSSSKELQAAEERRTKASSCQ